MTSSRGGTAVDGLTVGDHSAIEWTDATWNPVTGCTKISPGCKHCYAERLAERLQAMGNPRYRDGFKLTLHPDQLTLPLRWRDPRRIFVNSMSDLFHEDVPEELCSEEVTTIKAGGREYHGRMNGKSLELH